MRWVKDGPAGQWASFWGGPAPMVAAAEAGRRDPRAGGGRQRPRPGREAGAAHGDKTGAARRGDSGVGLCRRRSDCKIQSISAGTGLLFTGEGRKDTNQRLVLQVLGSESYYLCRDGQKPWAGGKARADN